MRIPALAALSLGVAASSAAVAADYPARVEIGRISAKAGMPVAQVALLDRLPGAGMNAVSETLVAGFADSADAISTREALRTERAIDHVRVSGKDWSLVVHGDGTRMRYRNYGYLESVALKGVPLAQRMSQDTLEKLGRGFIDKRLAAYVPLGKGEALVPYFTQFQVNGSASTAPGAKPPVEEVVAATVVFARSIDGVPVLGPGSKVAVVFAHNGEPVGFDVDWSGYQPRGTSQKSATIDEIRNRMARLAPFGLDQSGTSLHRFECGYVDLGARKRDEKAPIQAGCLIHASRHQIVDAELNAKDPRSGHTTAAHLAVIPAGATVERDAHWPQALALLGEKPVDADVPGQTRR